MSSSTSTATTHTKKYIIECITTHFKSQGKRLTNLSKADIPRLMKIVEQYKIVIPEINKEEKKLERKQKMLENKQKKEEEEALEKIRKQEYQDKQDKLMKRIEYWNERPVEKMEWVFEYVQREFIDTLTDEIIEINKQRNYIIKRRTLILKEKLEKEGGRVELINDTDFSVNGINVSNGYLEREHKYTDEEIKNLHLRYYNENFEKVISYLMYDYELTVDEWKQERSDEDAE